METCKICGSLIIKGKCTNTHCGTDYQPDWREDPSHYLEKIIQRGTRELIVAPRVHDAPKLRGIKSKK